jgi:1,4-alpha-glucan branching enzyme
MIFPSSGRPVRPTTTRTEGSVGLIRTCPTKNGAVKVTFVLPAEQPSGRVSVVGDFNEWRPGVHELRKRSNDTRSVSLEVDPGTTLCFRYLATDDVWFDDPDAHRHDHRGGFFTVN